MAKSINRKNEHPGNTLISTQTLLVEAFKIQFSSSFNYLIVDTSVLRSRRLNTTLLNVAIQRFTKVISY